MLDPTPAQMVQLRDVFITKIQNKGPFLNADQLEDGIAEVLEHGFTFSASSCLVLLVFSLASIWGTYPDDERRSVTPEGGDGDGGCTPSFTMAVPQSRMRDSLIYLSMAQKRMSAAQLDDSLLGVVCFCLFGCELLFPFP